jgi:hypothetical protein
VYKLKDFNNWEPWDIEKIMDDHAGQGGGALCNYGGNAAIQEKLWKCGIPLAGTSLFGHSLIGEDTPPDAGYTPGWCTAHVSQYQRGQYGTGERYAFDITLYDGAGAQIGHVQKREVDEGGYLSMTSPLPYTLDLSSGQKDEDPVSFCYAGECWSCDDGNGGAHGCTLGDGPENGYEYGDREGDFGFTC